MTFDQAFIVGAGITAGGLLVILGLLLVLTLVAELTDAEEEEE